MKKQTLILNDYCTGEPVEIYLDAIKHVITSRIGTMVYSTIVCNNGQRIGVEQKEDYIKNRLASA